jgi:hypothetical protein
MKKKKLSTKLIKINQLIKIINRRKKVAVQTTTATASRKNGHRKKINKTN